MRVGWGVAVMAALGVWSASALARAPQAGQPVVPPPGTAGAAQSRALIDRYCITCHNERLKTGGLVLETLDLGKVHEQAEIWEKVLRRVRLQSMPPAGMPRPDSSVYGAFTSWLETSLDRAVARRPQPGRPPLMRRLNRTEYANAIRDLLDLELDVAPLLPADDSGYGFDNNADVLGVSPLLLERYLSAAGKISSLAIGDPSIPPGSETYRVRQDLSQDRHIEGLPLGTVGGTLAAVNVPVDGEYVVKAKLIRTNLGVMRGLEDRHTLEIIVDGRSVHSAVFGGSADYGASLANPTKTADEVDARFETRVPLKAGRREIGAAFLQNATTRAWRLQPFVRTSADPIDINGFPHVEFLSVTGPFNATAVGETPSRTRVFVCRPTGGADEGACAARVLETLARRAFRRPVREAEMATLLEFYDRGRTQGTFDAGIRLALQRILTSPYFIFRAERSPAGLAPGAVYRVSDLELASRLSFFLWSSLPDDTLLGLATQRRLGQSEVVTQQVRRMLNDRRLSLVSNFASQWLHLRNLQTSQPNSYEFPDFDDNLRQAMRRETELLIDSIIREDRSVLDLLRADYTFVNERLARHYGIKNIYGDHFRRVSVTDESRRGLLGHGSILTVTSYPNRTSPVQRGKWIVENLLGAPVPEPPANVPPFPENDDGAAPKSVRERLEVHRGNPACASCHRMFDPLGLAMEQFDGVGAWRTKDAGVAVDASGELLDGTRVNGPVELRTAILRDPKVFVQTLTEKLMIYALGRGLDARDMPSVRAIVRAAELEGFRISSLVLGIVRSPQFQMGTVPEADSGGSVNTIATVDPTR